MYDTYEGFEPLGASQPPPASTAPLGDFVQGMRRSHWRESTTPSFAFETRSMHADPMVAAEPTRAVVSDCGLQEGFVTQGFVDHFSSVINAPLPYSLRDSPVGGGRHGVTHAEKGSPQQTPRRASPRQRGGTTPSKSVHAQQAANYSRSAVHDALFNEGKVIRQYKEALREEAVRRELATMRSPVISRYALEREEVRARRGVRQDVVDRMEERVRVAKEKKQVRADEILAQRARMDALLLAEGDDDSFAESLDGDDPDSAGRPDERRRKGGGEDSRALRGRASEADVGHHVGGDAAKAKVPARVPRDGTPPARTPFQPRLTGKGRRAISKVTAPDFLTGWKHRQDQKVDHRRSEVILREVEDCQEAPDITRRSRLLAAKANARDGLVGLTPLEAMLERDRLRKLAQWERRQAQESEANLFHPRITLYAATLGETPSVAEYAPSPRSFNVASTNVHQRAQMPVSERLYADAFGQEERRVAKLRANEAAASAARRATSLVSYNAAHSESQEGDGDRLSVPIEESLLQRHAKLKAAQELKASQLRAAEQRLHQPVINPVSEAITSRLPHSTLDRLQSGHRSIFERPLSVPGSPEEVHFRDGAKQRRIMSMGEEEQFALKLAAYEEKRREKMRMLEARREDEAMMECTFAPVVGSSTVNARHVARQDPTPIPAPSADSGDDLTRYYALKEARLKGALPAASVASPHSPEDGVRADVGATVEERSQQWLARREAKLALLRDEAAARRAALDAPPPPPVGGRAIPSRGSVSRSQSVASDTIYADNKPWGMDEHIQRQQLSRRRVAEKEERLSGRPSLAAVSYNGPVPGVSYGRAASQSSSRGASASVQRAPSQQVALDNGLSSLQPPVGPADVREVLGLHADDLSYAHQYPSHAEMRASQRAYESSLSHQGAGEGGGRDQYIARHSTGVLIPPSLW